MKRIVFSLLSLLSLICVASEYRVTYEGQLYVGSPSISCEMFGVTGSDIGNTYREGYAVAVLCDFDYNTLPLQEAWVVLRANGYNVEDELEQHIKHDIQLLKKYTSREGAVRALVRLYQDDHSRPGSVRLPAAKPVLQEVEHADTGCCGCLWSLLGMFVQKNKIE